MILWLHYSALEQIQITLNSDKFNHTTVSDINSGCNKEVVKHMLWRLWDAYINLAVL